MSFLICHLCASGRYFVRVKDRGFSGLLAMLRLKDDHSNKVFGCVNETSTAAAILISGWGGW